MRPFQIFRSLVLVGIIGVASAPLFAQTRTARYEVFKAERLHVTSTAKCSASWFVSVYVRKKYASREFLHTLSKKIFSSYGPTERVTIWFSIDRRTARDPFSNDEDEKLLRTLRGIYTFEPEDGSTEMKFFPDGLRADDPIFDDTDGDN
jgi:hypothetical protein